MKTLLFLSWILVILFATAGTATAQDQPDSTKIALENELCPVMGNPIDSEVTTRYDGKTYAFCCPSCIARFNKNPKQYLKKMDQKKSTSGRKTGCNDQDHAVETSRADGRSSVEAAEPAITGGK